MNDFHAKAPLRNAIQRTRDMHTSCRTETRPERPRHCPKWSSEFIKIADVALQVERKIQSAPLVTPNCQHSFHRSQKTWKETLAIHQDSRTITHFNSRYIPGLTNVLHARKLLKMHFRTRDMHTSSITTAKTSARNPSPLPAMELRIAGRAPQVECVIRSSLPSYLKIANTRSTDRRNPGKETLTIHQGPITSHTPILYASRRSPMCSTQGQLYETHFCAHAICTHRANRNSARTPSPT